MSNVSGAISKLTASGLFATEPQERVGEIVGGSEFKCFGDIGVYKEGFSISFENGFWVARVSGEGQMIDEVTFPELDAAVEFVLASYRKKGAMK